MRLPRAMPCVYSRCVHFFVQNKPERKLCIINPNDERSAIKTNMRVFSSVSWPALMYNKFCLRVFAFHITPLQCRAHGLNPPDCNRTRVPVVRPYGRRHQTIPRSGCTAGPDIFHSGRSSNPPNRDRSIAFCFPYNAARMASIATRGITA